MPEQSSIQGSLLDVEDVESWMDDPKKVEAHFKAEPPGRFTFDDLDDDSLARVHRAYLRAIEDGQPEERLRVWLWKTRALQLRRFALRMRYGARDGGTDEYDRYYRLDEAPSYRLAFAMDAMRAAIGQRHILRYAEPAQKEAKPDA